MIVHTILNALERRAVVLLLVLLGAGTAGAGQGQPPVPPDKPAAMGMKMAEMKQTCETKHEAAASDIQALTKTLTAAKSSNDIVVLRAAIDAALFHLDGMQAKAAKCAGMMKADPPAAAPTKDDAAHKH
jgi:hypothetical protein